VQPLADLPADLPGSSTAPMFSIVTVGSSDGDRCECRFSGSDEHLTRHHDSD
jgi:hypothetical protein